MVNNSTERYDSLINGLLMIILIKCCQEGQFSGKPYIGSHTFEIKVHGCTVANEIQWRILRNFETLLSSIVTMGNRRKCTLFYILMIFLWRKKSVLKCHYQSASHVFWGNNLINHSKWWHNLTLFYSSLTDGKWMATFFQVRRTTSTVWKKGWRKCVKKRFLTIKYLGKINQSINQWYYYIFSNMFCEWMNCFYFRVRSTQNVALIQYRIPVDSQGFIFRVSFEPNDDRK